MPLPLTSVRSILIATVPGDFELAEVGQWQKALLSAVVNHRAIGAVLDVSQARVLDRFDADAILHTAKMTRLLGAQLLVAGLSPHVAAGWAELGDEIDQLRCAATVELALDALGVGDSHPPSSADTAATDAGIT